MEHDMEAGIMMRFCRSSYPYHGRRFLEYLGCRAPQAHLRMVLVPI